MNTFKMIPSTLFNVSRALTNVQFVRGSKHWDPKWKKLRKAKVIKVDYLENFEKKDNEIENDEKRRRMKERGIFPQKPWMEKPIYISCTGDIFEPYVPPEGDGKFSPVSTQGAKQNVEFLMKKTKSYRAFKQIRRYEEGFSANEFSDQVMDTYIDAHKALANKEKIEVMTQYVTEKLYPQMNFNVATKILKWEFLKSLEPARVVHARCTNLITDTNWFGQVTVRFHTQQKLSVYDRFGRLMSGSDGVPKDVLEYIVFEKHLSNEYGRWRLHGKIVPPWMPIQKSTTTTFIVKN